MRRVLDWTTTTDLFVVLDERGAAYGPFDSTISASAYADKELGEKHAWRILRVIRPANQKT